MSEEPSKATPRPWKIGHGCKGTYGQPQDQWMPFTFVQTDFHTLGKIKNGPEATICEIARGETATCVSTGFQHHITDTEAAANAALIVRAVNAYDDLLAACENIMALASGWDKHGALGAREPLSWETVARMAMDYARDAAQKARG